MTGTMFEGELQNRLRNTGTTVTWEICDIWNLTFDGVSSPYIFLSDHTLYLHARRYETSIAIYLVREGTTTNTLRLLAKLWLIDFVGHERFIGEKEVVSEKPKDKVLLESLMVSDLKREKTRILQGDVLTISCSLSASYRLNLMKKGESETDKPILCFETLSSDFEKLYNAQNDYDVVIKAENTEFFAHQTVLSARSPKFASMFNHDALKNSSGKVDIACLPCIKAATFSDVLYYMYTGKISELTSETAMQLYTAAKLYSLSELMDVCRNFLQCNMTTANIFEVANTAYTYSDEQLKEEIQNFIVKNVPEILKSDDWRDFKLQRHVFANEILTDVLCRMKNKS